MTSLFYKLERHCHHCCLFDLHLCIPIAMDKNLHHGQIFPSVIWTNDIHKFIGPDKFVPALVTGLFGNRSQIPKNRPQTPLENNIIPWTPPSPWKNFLDGQSVYSKTAYTQKAKVCTFLWEDTTLLKKWLYFWVVLVKYCKIAFLSDGWIINNTGRLDKLICVLYFRLLISGHLMTELIYFNLFNFLSFLYLCEF